MPMLRVSLALTCVVALAATAAASGGQWRSLGMYPTSMAGSTSGTAPLPMISSDVSITVTGAIVEATVTQTFVNRSDRPVEATYIFPLPSDAAVTAMSIEVGNRTIVAGIEARGAAQRRYEAAIRAGVQAAMLEQERSDVFTQTIAAVPARGQVKVMLRFDALARYTAATWSLVLPMVVAPRYVPGTVSGRGTSGSGRAADTDRAPDASRVTPGASPGGGGATRVRVVFTDAVEGVASATHTLSGRDGDFAFTDPKTDHDAVIRWTTTRPAAGWMETTKDGGFAAVVVQADAAAAHGKRKAARAYVIVDHAATMKGDAAFVAQPFVRTWLGTLGSDARLAVMGQKFAAPADANRQLETLWTGTSRAFDLSRVLTSANPDGAPIVLITDGLVADDRAVLAAGKRLGVPIHVIAVGPAPARGLLEQLAATTGGTIRFVLPSDDLGAIALALTSDLVTGATPLVVNWGALAVTDVVPAVLPRLGAGQAIIVLAKLQKTATTANVRVRGELFALEALPSARRVAGAVTTVGPLGRRWAKLRLDDLLVGGGDPKPVSAHALAYGLVSPFTTLVAIGDRVDVQGGVKHSVAVPVAVPAGMHWIDVKQETTPAAGGEVSHVDVPDPHLAQPSAAPIATAPTSTLDDEAEGGSAKKPTRARDERTSVARTEPADGEPATVEDDVGEVSVGSVAAAPQLVSGDVVQTSMSSHGLRRGYRISTMIGGGFARAKGTSSGLFALGIRGELVRHTALFGVEATLLVVGRAGGDVQGRTLLTLGKVGVGANLVELGFGVGLHFGAGTGPAGSLALRLHVPRLTGLAGVARYDGALLYRGDDSAAQHAFSVGFEYGF